MGWTGEYWPSWKNHGTADRKAHIDSMIEEYGQRKVLKSVMVGTTYYAAVQWLKSYEKVESGGDRYGYAFFDLPAEKQVVYGQVVLTQYFKDEFRWKDMSEDMGPGYCDCPMSILSLLSPTESYYANEWRQRCIENNEKKKAARKNPESLSNLPVGATIQFPAKYNTNACKAGETVTLTKRIRHNAKRDTSIWYGMGYRWPTRMIPEKYTVLSEVAI